MKFAKSLLAVVLFGTASVSLNSCQCSESFGLNINPDFKYISDMALYVLSETSTNQNVKLAVNFINEAEKSCCDKSNATNQQKFRVNIYYNENNPSPSNWGTPVEDGAADKKALNACEEDNGEAETKFLKNGYYLVEMILDFLDATNERDENNNNSTKKKSSQTVTNMFKDNEKFGNNRIFKVVHVKGLDDSKAVKHCEIISIR